MKKKILVDDTHVREAFAANLKRLIADRKLNQTQLAEKLAVTPDLVSRWMRLKSAPTWCTLVTICDMFDVKVSDLLKDDEAAQRYEFDLFKQFRRFSKATGGFTRFKSIAKMG